MSKKEQTQQAAKNVDSLSQILKPIWLYALCVTLVVLACAAVINLLEAQRNSAAQLQAASQQLVRTQAAGLARFITDQQAFLAFLGAQQNVREVLAADGDEAALRSLEADLRLSYPAATRINLVPLSPLGTAALDFPEHLLNSIETDMIIKAVRGKPVAPEAYKDEGKGVVTLLQTIAGEGGELHGALLLSLESKVIRQVLEQLADGQGQLALQQKLNNADVTVFVTGSGDDSSPTLSTAVPGIKGWHLGFRASTEMASAYTASPLVTWIMLATAALLLGAAGLWIHTRLRGRLRHEFSELLDYLRQLKAGERALPPALSLTGLTEAGALAFDISQLPPISGKPTRADAEATAELSEKMTGKSANKGNEDTDYVEEAAEAETPAAEPAAANPPPAALPAMAEAIFRAYDIRGIVDEDLTADTVYQIGQAIGSEAQDQGQQAVIVARDGRLSSEDLAGHLCRGLQDSGVDVIDLGLAPTPVLYFATQQLNTASGVMVTGSHNPPQYNGLKVVINGKTLYEEAITDLKRRVDEGRLRQGSGTYSTADICAQYIDYVLGDIAVAQPLKVVIDCGNGVTGALAPRLFEDLGCEVIPLYCEVDGTFPNHHPDPSRPENLTDLVEQVKAQGADLGIAFDGDGDRVAVVSGSGEMVAADRLLMLFAQDVVSRNPGCDVIFDVKCTRHLNDVIASYGGRPIMWKSGHSLIKQKMVETGALLGGEFSGHIFFKERWFGFDDGLYSAARLIEIMSTTNPDLDQLLEQFPKPCGTPEIQLEVGEERKFEIVEHFAAQAQFGDAKISQIDGIRVDMPDGWGLLRASNTTPKLILRFEAESEEALAQIQEQFQAELSRLEPQISF